MARFVLVHGSWQGAWCWRQVASLLEAQGHEAVAIDLPGHSQDSTPPESVTFQDYVDRTFAVVNGIQGDSILVGHSMGGAIIRQAAGFAPDRIRALVSVAALLPPRGPRCWALSRGSTRISRSDPVGAGSPSARISPEGFGRFVSRLSRRLSWKRSFRW